MVTEKRRQKSVSSGHSSSKSWEAMVGPLSEVAMWQTDFFVTENS